MRLRYFGKSSEGEYVYINVKNPIEIVTLQEEMLQHLEEVSV